MNHNVYKKCEIAYHFMHDLESVKNMSQVETYSSKLARRFLNHACTCVYHTYIMCILKVSFMRIFSRSINCYLSVRWSVGSLFPRSVTLTLKSAAVVSVHM